MHYNLSQHLRPVQSYVPRSKAFIQGSIMQHLIVPRVCAKSCAGNERISRLISIFSFFLFVPFGFLLSNRLSREGEFETKTNYPGDLSKLPTVVITFGAGIHSDFCFSFSFFRTLSIHIFSCMIAEFLESFLLSYLAARMVLFLWKQPRILLCSVQSPNRT